MWYRDPRVLTGGTERGSHVRKNLCPYVQMENRLLGVDGTQELVKEAARMSMSGWACFPGAKG